MKSKIVMLAMLFLTACFKPKKTESRERPNATVPSPTSEIDPELEELNRPVTANPANLETISGGFGVDRATGKIYYYGRELINADINSFVVLSPRFAKDNNQAYIDHVRVKGADPATFEFIHSQIAKDKNHVYYLSSPLEGADAATFVQVQPLRTPKPDELYQDAYFKDKNTIFARNGRNVADSDYLGTAVNPATFVYYGGPFTSINGKVYANFQEMVGVDPNTFEFLECRYIPRQALESPPYMPIYCYGISNGKVIERKI